MPTDNAGDSPVIASTESAIPIVSVIHGRSRNFLEVSNYSDIGHHPRHSLAAFALLALALPLAISPISSRSLVRRPVESVLVQ
ncbi:hypothetical protein J6590_043966 [Homalodisca vitripennis]|nr:hypothetical protein J6590_043966 [Homalodisca vitripennis]